MLNINGKTIESFNAKVIDRSIESNEIVTVDDWLDGAMDPIFIRQQERFKNINIKILIEGDNEEDAYMQFSKLTSELKFCELSFQDIPLAFKGTLVGTAVPDRIRQGVFQVEYNIKSSYGIGAETIFNKSDGSQSFSINNIGTAKTPCIIEITPTQDISSISFEGFSEKVITVKNIKNGEVIEINGEKNIISYGSKDGFRNYDGWSFPYLKAGLNNLKVNSVLGYKLKIKYKPRFI